MKLIFPVYMLVTGTKENPVPFVFGDGETGPILPLFATDEASQAFCLLAITNGMTTETSMAGAQFNTARQLLEFLAVFMPKSASLVWADGRLLSTTDVQFSVRLKLNQFLAALVDQTAEDSNQDQN